METDLTNYSGNVVKIVSNKIEVDQTIYTGGPITLKLKASTEFSDVYKDVTITEVCGKQTVTANSETISFEAVAGKNEVL